MVDPKVDVKERVLLSDGMAAGDHLIKDVSVSEQDSTRDSKTYRIAYTVNGLHADRILTVERTGRTWLLFDRWTITTPMLTKASLTVPRYVDSITVNGKTVDLTQISTSLQGESDSSTGDSSDGSSKSAHSYALYLYPGSYDVATKDSKYLTAATNRIDDYAPSIILKPQAKDTLKTEINDQIKQHVDECLTSHETSDAGCGFINGGLETDYTDYGYDTKKYSNINRKLTAGSPTLNELNPLDSTFRTDDMQVHITYQYQWASLEGFMGPTSGENDVTGAVSGSFSVKNGQLKVLLDDSDSDE
ncbi:hypothetical protein [Bifidobacterium margollesii]|nr:hypothetical protein [Bifidobacterium margollesii]